MSNDDDKTIPPQLIQDALQRVLGSREIVNSDRKKRFLKFIVQEALDGHANRIKAYTIAIDAFDRAPSFDPVSDPVVRIEAGRLRRCLEHYYLTEGHEDPLLIMIPKGSYVPLFMTREHNSSSLPQSLGNGCLIDGQKLGVFPVEAAVNQVPVAATSPTPTLSRLV